MQAKADAQPKGPCSDFEQPPTCSTNAPAAEKQDGPADNAGEPGRAAGQVVVPEGAALLSLRQVATMLGICTKTVRRQVASGQLPGPVKIGAARRFVTDEVLEFIESLKVGRRSNHVNSQGMK